MVLGNSLYYINSSFCGGKKSKNENWSWDEFELKTPPNAKGSLRYWMIILDRCRTASMLLQLKGGKQTKWEHRNKNPTTEKQQSTQQVLYIIDKIFDKLLKVSQDDNPACLPIFWALCSELRGICLRLKSTGSTHQVANHIRNVKKKGASTAVLEEMRIRGQAKKTPPSYTLKLTTFVQFMWKNAQQRGSTHPWVLILEHLCRMASDELDETICLAHEHTIRTFEAILKPEHPFVLDSWSRFFGCWAKRSPRSARLLQRYERNFSQYTAQTASARELHLPLLYEYALASWQHSKDQDLQLDLAQRLLQLSYRLIPEGGTIQDIAVSRAVYLAANMIGVHWSKEPCRRKDPDRQRILAKREQAIQSLRQAVGLLEQGDDDCQARVVELSRHLATLHRRCHNFADATAEVAKLVRIRSSLPAMPMPIT